MATVRVSASVGARLLKALGQPTPSPRRRPAAGPAFDPFVALVVQHGFPAPETEARFHPSRKWRADYLWRNVQIIIEKDGGIFVGGTDQTAHGGHSAGKGILRDMAKGNAAQLLGYVFLRYTPQELARGAMLPALRDLFARRLAAR